MTLHITELSGLANTGFGGGSIPAISADAITSSQNVVTSAGSTQSAAFFPGGNQPQPGGLQGTALPPTRFLALTAGANCSVAFGANPTAVAGAGFYITSSLPPIIIAVTPGSKLAVIADTP